jgi:hypothetical protein
MLSLPQVSGTLDEAGDPRLWFRIAGRLSTAPPYREKETMSAPRICFLTTTDLVRLLRAWRYELAYGELLEDHRDVMKDTVVWEATRYGERRPPLAG